ncbi:MAG: hypothetical protein HY806_04755, partial [Nitrospirae bacterium]|nr:hypothetical protein [Nitrospirota bacterium]
MTHTLQTTHAGKTLLRKPIVHILLIVIIGLIAYSNTFHVPFQFDDTFYIVENPVVKDSQYFIEPSKIISGHDSLVKYTFKTRYMGFLTFAINYKLHGINVIGYHIFNFSIHIINALLVYWLVLLTFQTPYFNLHPSTFNPCPSLIALFSSLLFVSHPVQTQAVTYISQRFTSFATFFYLLSLVMYVMFRTQNSEFRSQNKPVIAIPTIRDEESRDDKAIPELEIASAENRHRKDINIKSIPWYLAALASAVLAMKTKEITFTLPMVITLYEFMFFDRNTKKRLLSLIPLILTILIIPLSLISIGNPIENIIGDVGETARAHTTIPRLDYFFSQFRVIVTYLRLLFLPINQNLDYDYPIY